MTADQASSPLLRQRASVAEFAIVVVVAALGINLVSNAVGASSGALQFLGGVVLLAGVLARALWQYGSARTISRHFQACVIVRREDGAILPIRGYDFAEQMSNLGAAGFLEDDALRRQWEHCTRRHSGMLADHPYRYALLTELSEYLVLERLAFTLESLFSLDDRSEEMVTIDRKDIPDSILANRFLDQFTRLPQDRLAFGQPVEDNVVLIMGTGLYFHRFKLTLPARSTLSRVDDCIRVTHPLMTCDLSVRAAKHALNVPFPVNPYLTPATGEDDGTAIDIGVRIRFHVRSLMARGKRLTLHSWALEFARQLEADMAFDRFLGRIQVPLLEVLTHILEAEGMLSVAQKKRRLIEREWERRSAGQAPYSGPRIHRHWLDVPPESPTERQDIVSGAQSEPPDAGVEVAPDQTQQHTHPTAGLSDDDGLSRDDGPGQ